MAIPKKLLNEILQDEYYETCARADECDCKGRITFEHALIYAGRQIQEKWAILPICAYHHAVDQYQDCGKMDKNKHEWLAISRMTEEDMQKYPRFDWKQRLKYLNTKYL